MPVGVENSRVADWTQNQSHTSKKLNEVLEVITRKKIKFDFVFFHQGSSDAGLSKYLYKTQLEALINRVRSANVFAPWMIARHSRCGATCDKEIEEAQTEFVNGRYLKGYFSGPNTNQLDNKFRFDDCHLNRVGQEAMAALWLESYKDMLALSKKVRNESLLYLFD